jgi:hypothetical protein
LDHDSAARDRSLRVLALFREKESRDELGIGSIRDAIAELLFPGTSTIQTRLRYMLLVPWMYAALEARSPSAAAFGAEARKAELAMVKPLMDANEAGVFGAQAGGDLKRLPSSVYWSGLGRWGIRKFKGSQSEYHRQSKSLALRRSATPRHEDDDLDPDLTALAWHPSIPTAPEDFPAVVDLTLSRDEASFIRDRIVASCDNTLLGWLALHGESDDAAEPWLHHQVLSFPVSAQTLLKHARLLSDAMEAAARVYSLCLAELAGNEEWIELHRTALEKWQSHCDLAGIREWNLADFWSAISLMDYVISSPTRTFVEAWITRVIDTDGRVADDAPARKLIKDRETTLKSTRSRFKNPGALKQWGGSSGVNRLVYRWPTTKRFLDDLLVPLGSSARK